MLICFWARPLSASACGELSELASCTHSALPPSLNTIVIPKRYVRFSVISVSNVKSPHATTFSEVNKYKEAEKLHLCRVPCQIRIPPFAQFAVCVRCYGRSLLLAGTHPGIGDRTCLMAQGTHGNTLVYAILYAFRKSFSKAIPPPRSMTVASTSSALAYFINTRSDKCDTLDGPKLRNMTQDN